MIYTLHNDVITAKITDVGAEMLSVVRNEDGCEYIWQGDPTYWKGHAPWLFPICSHLYEDRYTYGGKTYHMGTHGFARHMTFEAVRVEDTVLSLRLCSSEKTKESFPFDFSLTITYTLVGETLHALMDVENTGDQLLPIAPGAHPGFNVPLGGKGSYDDYYLEFAKPCDPDELVLTEAVFNSGRKIARPLREGKYLDLSHSLFVIDGIFLDNVTDTVTLRSDKSERYVTMYQPDTPYLGLWSIPQSDAPYVCIEPWCGLPSYDGVIDDLATRNDTHRVLCGEHRQFRFDILFG